MDEALAHEKTHGSRSDWSCSRMFNLATLVSQINTPLRFGSAGVRREAAQRGCWAAVRAQGVVTGARGVPAWVTCSPEVDDTGHHVGVDRVYRPR
jgi:hypothetical protein